jgi:hypothetical protein
MPRMFSEHPCDQGHPVSRRNYGRAKSGDVGCLLVFLLLLVVLIFIWEVWG